MNYCPIHPLKIPTIISLLQHYAEKWPDRVVYTFLNDDGSERIRLTFSALFLRCQAIAASLEGMGMRGKVAALLFYPGLDFIPAFLGCLQAGTIAVPLYSPRREQELTLTKALLSASGARAVLLDRRAYEVLDKFDNRWAGSRRVVIIDWLDNAAYTNRLAENFSGFCPRQEDVAFIQFTSGSAGMPKGVAVSHANIINNQKVIKAGFQHSEETTVVGWLPFHHDMGLIGNLLQPLYLGQSCVLMAPTAFTQKPIRWLEAISKYSPTTSGGPNFAYELCINAITDKALARSRVLDLSGWSVAFTGAEPVQADTLERFYHKFKPVGFRFDAFYPCYGMSETTLMLTGISRQKGPHIKAIDNDALIRGEVVGASNQTQNLKRIVCCGRSWEDNHVIVVNPQTGQLLKEGEIGEIWARGPSIAQGYWENAPATKHNFQAELHNVPGKHYLRTGDLGFLENDELYVTGRLKSLLIINGRNFYPDDIEATVAKAHSAFRPRSAVFEIQRKGTLRLVAVQEVYRHLAQKLNQALVEREVRKLVTATHGIYLHDIVLTTDRIPLTTSGKIKREACRDALLNKKLTILNSLIN